MQIIPINHDLSPAVAQINQGWCVVFPTETVYGLGANVFDVDAVKKIFAIKRRPADNPLIVHCADKAMIETIASIVDPLEQVIIDTLMPGPITILLRKQTNIPDIVTAWNSLVGVRIPEHPIAQHFLRLCEVPICAPSANTSGRVSPTTIEMVNNDLGNRVSYGIDGGPCAIGIESTVVRVDQWNIIIERPWFITPEDFEEITSNVIYSTHTSTLSPWNKYAHYAPQASVQLLTSIHLLNQPKRIGVIATQERIDQHQTDIVHLQKTKNLIVYQRWSRNHLLQCAQRLYQTYAQADRDERDIIFIEPIKPVGIGYALMNRINKSCRQ